MFAKKTCGDCPWSKKYAKMISCPLLGKGLVSRNTEECTIRYDIRVKKERWNRLLKACHKQRDRAIKAESK